VSVTLRYCIDTAKGRITQTMPHDTPRSQQISIAVTPTEVTIEAFGANTAQVLFSWNQEKCS